MTVELDVICRNINSDASISMAESPFSKLVKILDKLIHEHFGNFDANLWQFTDHDGWIDTSFYKKLSVILVS
jgi:hypothetical protein